jgi:hypothetical protein
MSPVPAQRLVDPVAGKSPPGPAYSMLRSSPAFVVLAVGMACAANYADPDLWIHVLAGQRMVATGHILTRDLYSYAAPGLPWDNHEWLSEIVLGMSYRWLGVVGLKLVKLICATVMMVALSMGLSRTAAPPRLQRFALLAVAAALISQMQFRPTLFSLTMLSIVIAKLAAEVYSGPVRLWTLIPLFALWANFHAGCFAGLGALGIFAAVCGVQELINRRAITRAWSVAAVTLGCALATLVNPLGTGLWTTFWHSASDPLMRSIITDWVPLPKFLFYISQRSTAELVAYLVPLLMFAGLPAALVEAPVFDDAALVAIALVFTAGAFYANRNVGLAVIAVGIPFARHLGIAAQKRKSAAGKGKAGGPQPATILVIAAAVLIALLGGEFSDRLEAWDEVPSGAVAFLKAHGLHGNILNNFDWGEYLIWHVSPDSKVFIDARYQLVYPEALRRQYLGFLYGWPGGQALLDRYPHDFVLVKPGTGAYRLVDADRRWKLVYRDPVAALYARSSAVIPGASKEVTSRVGGPSFFP